MELRGSQKKSYGRFDINSRVEARCHPGHRGRGSVGFDRNGHGVRNTGSYDDGVVRQRAILALGISTDRTGDPFLPKKIRIIIQSAA
jgi:hypothetical protein